MVRIQHLLADGSYIYSQYEHLMSGSLLVSYGQIVTMGQSIAQVGDTGFVTGPHLHFEIKSVNEDGVGYTFGNAALIVGYVDPIAYVATHMLQPPTSTPTPTLAPPTAVPPTVSAPISETAPVSTAASSGPGPRVSTSSESTMASDGGEHQAVLAGFYKRYHDYVTVTAEHLNVRAGSGFNYAPLNSVDKGARLGYLGSTGNGWVHVALPGDVYGYVVRQWVEGAVLPAAPIVDSSYKPPFDVVTDTRYPARSGPYMHSVAVEPLQQGEKLAYLGTLGSWDKIVLPDDRVAWVLNWYVNGAGAVVNLNATTPAPAATAPAASTNGTAASSSGKTAAIVKAPAATPAAAPSTSAAGPAMVTTVDGLNLREGPRLAAGVIEVLPRGTRLTLHGYHTSWAAVSTADGHSGYVLATLIKPATAGTTSTGSATTSNATAPSVTSSRSTSSSGQAALSAKGPDLVVVVYGANVRAAPTKKAAVVTSEPYHARISQQGAKGDWVYIRTANGVYGWMKRELTGPATGHAAA
jgi:uncharacterized protein YgiM (DUF1202 family)